MADFRAIGTVSETLVGLIKRSYEAHKAHFNLENLNIQCKLIQAKDLQEDTLSSDWLGVSVYLYRVALNANRRNLPSRLTPEGKRLPPSLALDLHYLLTAWWGSAKEQQWLLALAMRALEDMPLLNASLLNHYGKDSIFGEDETVDLIGEVLAMTDLLPIWEINKNKMQPSATYVARTVLIDSERELTEAKPVQIRDFVLAHPRGAR